MKSFLDQVKNVRNHVKQVAKNITVDLFPKESLRLNMNIIFIICPIMPSGLLTTTPHTSAIYAVLFIRHLDKEEASMKSVR